jgi:hypothetical protein
MSSLGQRSRMLREVIGWLNGGFSGAAWTQADWQLARETLVRQGLTAYLVGQGHLNQLPQDLQAWMQQEYASNQARIQRLQDDLVQVLSAAHKAGVELLLLKGLNLGLHYYASPYQRVMADLDLMVHLADGQTMQKALELLGYELEQAAHDHLYFIRPHNRAVASLMGEHPDNPRPVELHWGLERHYHSKGSGYRLGGLVWEQSQSIRMQGQPVRVPTPERLLIYLATHTTLHLTGETGRLIQWLDLALVATRVKAEVFLTLVKQAQLSSPAWVYLSLTLASRALVKGFPALGQLGLEALEPSLPRRLVRWAKTVPLDRSCGLCVYATQDEVKQGRVYRIISPWRATFAYPKLPLPLALAGQGLYGLGKLLQR